MRTTKFLLSSAAAVAISGFGIVGNLQAQNTARDAANDAANRAGNAIDRAGNAIQRTGDRLTGSTTNPSNAMAPDAEDIRETLREVTEAALTKGGFDDLVERFVDADRNRLGKDGFTEKDHTTLDGRIAQLQKDWKAKYNQDFKIPDKEAVFNASFASIIQSEIGGAARLASETQRRADGTASGNVTVPATPDNRNMPNTAAPGNNTNPGITGNTAPGGTANRPNTGDANRVAGGDTNREPGRNVATVQVAASHGMPSLSVPMVHEFPDRWKIDAPDNSTAEQLHDRLLKHLTMVNDQMAQWPADVNDAYRVVSHHVLMAVLNIDQNSPSNQLNPLGTPGSMTPSAPGGLNTTPGTGNNTNTLPGNTTPGSATPGGAGAR